MSFKPEDLTEISMHAYIDEHFIINTIDKDKQKAFLMNKLGSAAFIEQIKELTAGILADIGVWHSDNWDTWEVAECTYQEAWFLYPSGDLSHVISDIHQNYDVQQWADKRYVVQEDDAGAKRLDSKTVGLIVTALAFAEASLYRGYNYDTRVMLDTERCNLLQALGDAHYRLCGDGGNALLDNDTKAQINQMMKTVLDTLFLHKESC